MSRFDRFANWAGGHVANAWFFIFCVLLIVIWAPSGFIFGFGDMYHLLINTPTTVITFLLVALLHNDQARTERALNLKLDAIAYALSRYCLIASPDAKKAHRALLDEIANELRRTVGLEDRVSAKGDDGEEVG